MAGTDDDSPLLARLRKAVAPQYTVEREIARGGMGIVFLGHHSALDRPVAIKLLIPEMASAELAIRFVREAKVLAKVHHPNIVTVYDAQEADGLFYYIMEYLDGETLHTRLERGPLRVPEALDLADGLLAALSAAHKQNWVHRDVKPGNIFLTEERAILTDFGVAKPMEASATELTGTLQLIGTLSYMAPEQLEGQPATKLSDIYAAGLVLYEALTNRRWSAQIAGMPVDWSGVPGRLIRIVRKALCPLPEDRWQDAASFRQALGAASRARRLTPVLLGAAVLSVVIVVAHILTPPCTSWRRWFDKHCIDTRELLAVEPFSSSGPDSILPRDLTLLVRSQLEGIPGIPLISPQNKRKARQNIRGTVTVQSDTVRLRLSYVRDSVERWSLTVQGPKDSPSRISDDAASGIMVQLLPQLRGFVPGKGFSRNPKAIGEFVAGDIAFRSVNWEEAERRYTAALEQDTSFALAAWRRANVRRWRRLSQEENLLPLYQQYRTSMRDLDRMLIEAQIQPDLKGRLDKYQQAVDSFPTDGYAALFYADELMHRGPLVGRPLSEAINWFYKAVDNDSALAPAWFHIGWANIRLGNRAAAEEAFQHQARLTPIDTTGTDLDLTLLLKLTLDARFFPDSAEMDRKPENWTDRARVERVVRSFRWAMSFDVPEGQLEYARMLAGAIPSASVQASSYSGQGIALVALGRPREALAAFDTAAALRGTAEADLHRAEWRVLPGAFDLYPMDSIQLDQGRRILRRFIGSDFLGARAAWGLAMDARARSDSADYTRYRQMVEAAAPKNPGAERLWVFLQAEELARLDPKAALDLSAPLLSTDSAGRFGDPFARALLHLRRGEWWQRLGQPRDTESEWMWYEHSDLADNPVGEVQPIEVDWALGTIAKSRRAELDLANGRVAEGCAHARRVQELWKGAEEPAFGALLTQVRDLLAGCPQ